MEAVGKLAGGIAHDFNNVLTAIIGFSDLLLQTHRPTDAAYKDIMNIKQNANRAAGMVRQLLAFSRRQTLKPETLELGEVLTDLSVLLNRLIGEKVELKIVSRPRPVAVKADRTQFDQVIINLAVNARDAMPDGGTLAIRTRNVTEREGLKLRAPGVTAGRLRAGRGRGHRHRHAARGHGQDLRAVLLDQGSRQGHRPRPVDRLRHRQADRRLHLPREHDRQGHDVPRLSARATFPSRRARRRAAQAKPKKERVARPDRHRARAAGRGRGAVRAFAVRALQRQGYKVLEATTGVEALEIVAEPGEGRSTSSSPTWSCPKWTARPCSTSCARRRPDLKMIFVSGYPEDAFKKNLDPEAQFAFLPKPFTLPQLAAKVKEELAR